MDKLLFDNNVMRQLCTVRQYLNDRNIPLVASVGAAAIIAEGGAYPTNDAAFGNVSLTSFKLGNIQLVTEEMLNDTPQNLAQDIWEMYSESFGGSEEDYFTTGTGSGQPQGSNVGATVGETAASATAVTYDELVNLFSSLAEKYARNGTAMCNRLTAAVIRKLKDSNGQPIWQPRMTEANPEMILGSPLRINESMPAMTTGLKPISFGDMSYHVIADRERLTMQVLNELYAGNGRTGLKFRKRIDSRLKRSDAIKVLEMA
jgi:HK97 family phage major capsid protein